MEKIDYGELGKYFDAVKGTVQTIPDDLKDTWDIIKYKNQEVVRILHSLL